MEAADNMLRGEELSALRSFVIESNRIEGITRAPTTAEVREHWEFMALPILTADALERFVAVIAPGKPLRASQGMNVRVGSHIAPRGGPDIPRRLGVLLDQINDGLLTAWEAHGAYETLHPFMDGNGRSGRVLWLWQMLRDGHDPWALRRGFLHTFYYQTLGECRFPAENSASQSTEGSAREAPAEPNPPSKPKGEL